MLETQDPGPSTHLNTQSSKRGREEEEDSVFGWLWHPFSELTTLIGDLMTINWPLMSLNMPEVGFLPAVYTWNEFPGGISAQLNPFGEINQSGPGDATSCGFTVDMDSFALCFLHLHPHRRLLCLSDRYSWRGSFRLFQPPPKLCPPSS